MGLEQQASTCSKVDADVSQCLRSFSHCPPPNSPGLPTHPSAHPSGRVQAAVRGHPSAGLHAPGVSSTPAVHAMHSMHRHLPCTPQPARCASRTAQHHSGTCTAAQLTQYPTVPQPPQTLLFSPALFPFSSALPSLPRRASRQPAYPACVDLSPPRRPPLPFAPSTPFGSFLRYSHTIIWLLSPTSLPTASSHLCSSLTSRPAAACKCKQARCG